MRNFTINNIVIVLVFTLTTGVIFGQITILKPSFGFTQACAGESFNSYFTTFSFVENGSGLGASNQFIIELSDATGSFDNATEIYTSDPGEFTTSPVTLGFSIPETTAGELYEVRIKSTDPVATSSHSDPFPAYYKLHDVPFTINNLVATGEFCAGGSYLLTIDNPGESGNESPLQYPSLTFNWFRSTGPTTSVFITTAPSLSVDEPGTYFVNTNYGTCTSQSTSNRVTIGEVGGEGVSATIESSLGNPYCATDGPTTLSTINGNSYQWFKDGIEIIDATNQTYETNESGTYAVSIDLGTCTSTPSINLSTANYTSDINIDIESNYSLQDGETLEVILTTTADSPAYEWYLNGSIIPSATQSTLNITSAGAYRAVITPQGGTCIASTEFNFSVIQLSDAEFIPNLVSQNNDGQNDTWILPQEYISGTNTNIVIISSQGETVLETNNYLNDWPTEEIEFIDVNPVYYYVITTQDQDIKKGSITVVK